MGDYSAHAIVNLQINGQQAEKVLEQLKIRAHDLMNAIAKAAAAGNKTELNKLRKELRATKSEIKTMESAAMDVQNVLARLDKSSLKELQRALRQLEKELNNIERGSSAWNTQLEKIKRVRAEISKVNAEMRMQDSLWERFNRKLNDWQMSIMGFVATMAGVIMAARNAVKTFANMEEEIANTRKYTGMTVEDVEKLNEAFEKLDTRTPREKLNELAQEAGRLGFNTLDKVQQYVEAADIIRVALVDLGEGATQSIAKMTNIFGDAQRMGIKDSMLAVGSAVNVLSQNCTASKPYLVNFTERMAGIGAQARLTIPNILAFGAVLDANGQKVEMSASAVGKLIMNLFQKPGEIAKIAGLNVEEFTKTLTTSTLDGVMMFLDAIHKMGNTKGLEVLAPMFKDLGLDGVRMSQVLASLAAHIEELRWQLGEADKAYNEATSATNEYNIFNNTAQASLDKARKRVTEMAVELGEKLFPVMRHVLKSTTLLLKVLSTIIDFLVKYHKEIITATAAIVAYNIVVNATILKLRILYVLQAAYIVLYRAAAASVSLVTSAYFALTGQIERAGRQMKMFFQITRLNPWGLLVAGISAATVGIGLLIKKMKEEANEDRKLMASRQARAEVDKEVNNRTKAEIANVRALYNVLQDSNMAYNKRHSALVELQKLVPDYHGALTIEGQLINDNTAAIEKYIDNLQRAARAQVLFDKLKEYESQMIDTDETIGKKKGNIKAVERQMNRLKETGQDESTYQGQTGAIYKRTSKAMREQQQAMDENQRALKNAQIAKERLQNKIDYIMEQIKGSSVNGFTPSDQQGDAEDITIPTHEDENKNKAKEDRFKKEKEWKEKEEALNRIAYARGEKDFEEYSKRKDEIEIEYNRKLLERNDLTETERLSIQADYLEAENKLLETNDKFTVEKEREQYNILLNILKQRYIDGIITEEEYEGAAELLELEHLRNIAKIYKAGTEEQLKAQKEYDKKRLDNQIKNKKRTAQEEKKLQDELKKIKEKSFGLNIIDRQQMYEKDLASLTTVYEQELKAVGDNAEEKLRIEKAFLQAKKLLIKKYNVEVEDDTRKSMEKMADDITSWLDSDGGKAIMGAAELLVESMTSIFSGLSDIVKAEMEIQTAAIEERYDKEIAAAEGNTYKEKKLEKEKEEAIAKAKNEANKKMFAMQVMQAVASTALSAINAYSSAAQVPLIGYILAPIAAGMALASGAIQIAAIKKQQQASETKGYSEGGYTPEGEKDKPVGIVHAGEWVASQKLLKNRRAKTIIDTLEYAQRTNSMGVLNPNDVSQSIMAPMTIANVYNKIRNTSLSNSALGGLGSDVVKISSKEEKEGTQRLSVALTRLTERLNEPFVTVNTVTGDLGIKKAQDDYEKLIRNKSKRK